MVVPRLNQLLGELERRGVIGRAAKLSLADFCEMTSSWKLHSWQRDYLCPILERCHTEKGLRIAIHGPPQYGKSIIVSQRFPAWLFGKDPNHKVVLACYNETRAETFGQVIKGICSSEEYSELFPYSAVPARVSANEFSTPVRTGMADGQSSFKAVGMLSGFTGRGPDTLIVDDPYKDIADAFSETINEKIWQWWKSTASVRIGEDANVIVMFHRYHNDDFASRLLLDGFEYVRFPVEGDENDDGSDPTGRGVGELLSPLRSRDWVEKQKEEEFTFYGMFQGLPRKPGSEMFRREYFEIVDSWPRLKYLIRGWDLAVSAKDSADQTAGVLMGIDDSNALVVLDVEAFRMEWPDAHDAIESIAKRERHPIAVDGSLSQLAFIQQLARSKELEWFEDEETFVQNVQKRSHHKVPMFRAILCKGKKERLSYVAHLAKRYGVKLIKAPWNEAFIQQLCSFTGDPVNKDDLADAFAIAHEALRRLPIGKYETHKEPEIGSPEFFKRLRSDS